MRTRVTTIVGIVALTAVSLRAQSTVSQIRLAEGETDPQQADGRSGPSQSGRNGAAYNRRIHSGL